MTCNITREMRDRQQRLAFLFASCARRVEVLDEGDARNLVVFSSLSDVRANVRRVRELREQMRASTNDGRDLEGDARLYGLLAALALPARRGADGVFRRPLVEVEVAPGKWAAIETIVIDGDGMTMSFGKNGHAVDYRFIGATCPSWRMP